LIDGGSVMMTLYKYPCGEKYGFGKDKIGMTWQLIIQIIQSMNKNNDEYAFCEQFGKGE
jgi:uncharacterized glyoxalase superfamily protein PhnB